MIIVKTPLRISFFGGGSDFKDYYEKYGGQVLSTAIDKFSYVILRDMPPYFSYKNQLNYSVIERFNSPEEVKHPLVREAMKYYGADGVQLVYYADLPARSGIGSSSSFSVGLVNAFHTMKNDNITKKQLAQEAIYLERELCREAGGVQDQIAAAYGGFNHITFDKNGFKVTPLEASGERLTELNENLMLFFTGTQRISYKVSENQQKNLESNASTIKEMCAAEDEAVKILKSKSSLNDFGRLLDYSWQMKKTLADSVSNLSIDGIYEKALKAGALGGKLSGAGEGGFMFFYAEKEKQENVKKALKDLIYVPFKFEKFGSRVIYNGSDF